MPPVRSALNITSPVPARRVTLTESYFGPEIPFEEV